MKGFFTLPAVVLLVFCQMEFTTCHRDVKPHKNKHKAARVEVPGWTQSLDSVKLKGALLVYDVNADTMYSNDFAWCEKGLLPASTFKIPNSIIALETGIVENDSTLIKWDGSDRRLDSWEKDMLFKDAFRESCVPCYQEIAREVGVRRMNSYLKKLHYGHMIVDSTSIDKFWLEGESKISMFEQVDFLQRFNESNLSISLRTERIMRRILLIEENNEYKLSGKTGWAIRNGSNNGWFVGYLESKGRTLYFATNVEPVQGFDIDQFSKVRGEITFRILNEFLVPGS